MTQSSHTRGRKARLNHQDIIRETAHIIAFEGLQELTMRNLAKRLSCSVGTLPHYFKGKDEIVEATLNWSSERILSRVNDVDIDNVSLDTFIPIIQSTLPFDKQSDIEWRVRLALWSYALNNEKMRDMLKEVSSNSLELLEAWATILQDKGSIRADINVVHLSQFLLDYMNGLAFKMLHQPMEERLTLLTPLMDYINSLR